VATIEDATGIVAPAFILGAVTIMSAYRLTEAHFGEIVREVAVKRAAR